MGVLGPDAERVINRNASEIATEMIREAIFSGRLESGRRLKEGELAAELGISRTPVREALMMLQAEGLVIAAPNRGAVVRSYTEKDLIDMYELREVLESLGARRAATRISPAQLDELERSCDAFAVLRRRKDRTALVGENRAFHSTIIEAANTSNLAELIQHAVKLPFLYSTYHLFSEAELEQSEQAHREILEALKAGRAKRAERLMKGHLELGRDFLVEHFARETTARAPEPEAEVPVQKPAKAPASRRTTATSRTPRRAPKAAADKRKPR